MELSNSKDIKMKSLANPMVHCGRLVHTTVNNLKLVKGCRIDTGSYKKAPSKTLETRVSSETGTGQTGEMGIELDRVYIAGLSAHCVNSYILQHILYIYLGCRN